MKRILCFAVMMLAFFSLNAGELTFDGKTDKDPLTYQPGETMTFTITLLEDGQPVSGKVIKWRRFGDDEQTSEGEAISDAENPLVVQTSIDIPGFAHIQATTQDEDGDFYNDEPHQFNGAAGVLVDQIQSVEEPADFDAFWARQKERLAEVPMVSHLTEVESEDPSVVCYDVKIDCVGMPVSGYLCMPRDAKEKSLNAHLSVHGYGVYSANKNEHAGKSVIYFDINAHGIENGHERSYYANLVGTTLASYGFPKESNQDPEKSYWNGVAMRVMRALEFLKSLPQWNGQELIVSGGSQGGFQTILAAGLDPDVTQAFPSITWLCDLSGNALNHRVKSCFFPEWTDALGYYDSVNHAKRIRGTVVMYAGIGDQCCPIAGELILYNNISAPVKMTLKQGATHGFHPNNAQVFEYQKNWKD